MSKTTKQIAGKRGKNGEMKKTPLTIEIKTDGLG